MPPFGHRRECATLLDSAVRDFTGGEVYPGAGAPHLVFRCLPAVLERSAAATTLPIAHDSVKAAAAAGSVVVEDATTVPATTSGGGGAVLDWGLVPDGASAARGPASATSSATSAAAAEGATTSGATSGGTSRRRCFVADGALGRLAWAAARGSWL